MPSCLDPTHIFYFIILIWNPVNWLAFIISNPLVSWWSDGNQRNISIACVRTSSCSPEKILQESVHVWMITKWISFHSQATKLCLKKLNSGCFQKQWKQLWHWREEAFCLICVSDLWKRNWAAKWSSLSAVYFKVIPSVKKKLHKNFICFQLIWTKPKQFRLNQRDF